MILEGLPMAEQAGQRVDLAEAKILADAIVADLEDIGRGQAM